MKDLELWRFVAEHLPPKQAVTLLVVAESSGSSPGRQGFKMAIAEDGTLFGSIGGGVMEVALVSQAKVKSKKLKVKNKSEIIEQIHRKNVPNSSGMICSGKQTVIFKELKKHDLATVGKIIESLKKQTPCRLQISNHKFQIVQNSRNNETYYFSKTGENEFIYQEKLGFQNKLIIIGGGHCALALSELMSRIDFHITVFDDRPDLNTLQKNEFAHRIEIIESYEKIGNLVESGENIFVVVMTLGYKFDEIVIRQLFDKNFKYFGVLGSKAKMKTLLQSLEKQGFDQKRLARIHTPIGLPINSHTPAEIAVSIAAEIIAVKNK
jgi:xanthine dehydrogenase accessory factor